jgi:site-specific DNA-methyltransferase (adenine-specific)
MNKIINGDCLEVLKSQPANSVDLIVTDPPYGYSFMGKEWDKAVPPVTIWKECLRVLKPGAFAFVMSAPRQDVLHRMIEKLEQAGFDTSFTSIYWAYASGFPKAMNLGKAVDRKLGNEREVVGRNPNSRENCDKSNTIYESGTVGKTDYITKGTSPLEGSYGGFQPKPAVEIIIVAMKPMVEDTYIAQSLARADEEEQILKEIEKEHGIEIER